MPDGIVPVGHGQWRQDGSVSGRVRFVAPHELVAEHTHRPLIADDMVDGHHHDVLGVGQANQGGPEQGAGLQVKRGIGDFSRDADRLRLASGVGFAAHVEPRKWRRRRRQDLLHWPAVPHGKHRAKGFVPLYQLPAGAFDEGRFTAPRSRSAAATV